MWASGSSPEWAASGGGRLWVRAIHVTFVSKMSDGHQCMRNGKPVCSLGFCTSALGWACRNPTWSLGEDVVMRQGVLQPFVLCLRSPPLAASLYFSFTFFLYTVLSSSPFWPSLFIFLIFLPSSQLEDMIFKHSKNSASSFYNIGK